MSSCVDVRADVRGDESKDHSGRLYWLNADQLLPVQHFSGGRSTAVPAEIEPERSGNGLPSGAVEPETIMIMRLMTLRQCSAALIGATLGMADDAVRDLAASLDLRAPQHGVARLAPDRALEPGTLRTTARLYTPRQLAFLARAWLNRVPIPEMSRELARSESAIKRKLRKMGFLQRARAKAWTELATLTGIATRQASERAIDNMLSARGSPPVETRSIFRWTLARTAILCERWLEGWTPAAIARHLGTTPGSVSTRATRASLPGRTREADGRLLMRETGYICLDRKRGEYFWSRRQTATQSAYRAAQASACFAFC